MVHVTERYGQTALPHAVTIGVNQENLQVPTALIPLLPGRRDAPIRKNLWISFP
jgi:hypothetical protein